MGSQSELAGQRVANPMEPAYRPDSLSIHSSLHLPCIYPSISSSITRLSVCPSISVAIHQHIHRSTHPSIHYLSFDCLSVHPSTCPFISVHPSMRFCVIHQCVAPSIPLLIRLPTAQLVTHTSLHPFHTSLWRAPSLPGPVLGRLWGHDLMMSTGWERADRRCVGLVHQSLHPERGGGERPREASRRRCHDGWGPFVTGK